MKMNINIPDSRNSIRHYAFAIQIAENNRMLLNLKIKSPAIIFLLPIQLKSDSIKTND